MKCEIFTIVGQRLVTNFDTDIDYISNFKWLEIVTDLGSHYFVNVRHIVSIEVLED